MTRSELCARVAARSSLSTADVAAALDALTSTITDALAERETVTVAGFGKFTARSHAVRQARSPAPVSPSLSPPPGYRLSRPQTPFATVSTHSGLAPVDRYPRDTAAPLPLCCADTPPLERGNVQGPYTRRPSPRPPHSWLQIPIMYRSWIAGGSFDWGLGIASRSEQGERSEYCQYAIRARMRTVVGLRIEGVDARNACGRHVSRCHYRRVPANIDPARSDAIGRPVDRITCQLDRLASTRSTKRWE